MPNLLDAIEHASAVNLSAKMLKVAAHACRYGEPRQTYQTLAATAGIDHPRGQFLLNELRNAGLLTNDWRPAYSDDPLAVERCPWVDAARIAVLVAARRAHAVQAVREAVACALEFVATPGAAGAWSALHASLVAILGHDLAGIPVATPNEPPAVHQPADLTAQWLAAGDALMERLPDEARVKAAGLTAIMRGMADVEASGCSVMRPATLASSAPGANVQGIVARLWSHHLTGTATSGAIYGLLRGAPVRGDLWHALAFAIQHPDSGRVEALIVAMGEIAIDVAAAAEGSGRGPSLASLMRLSNAAVGLAHGGARDEASADMATTIGSVLSERNGLRSPAPARFCIEPLCGHASIAAVREALPGARIVDAEPDLWAARYDGDATLIVTDSVEAVLSPEGADTIQRIQALCPGHCVLITGPGEGFSTLADQLAARGPACLARGLAGCMMTITIGAVARGEPAKPRKSKKRQTA